VAWDFDHVGLIEAEPATQAPTPSWPPSRPVRRIWSPDEEKAPRCSSPTPTDLDLVSRALPAQGFTVLTAKLGYKPKNPVDPASLSAEQLEEVESFLAAIDANDDVQNVYVALAG
jgi:hypothetical protein